MKNTIHTDKAPQAVGPYSQAVSIQCQELIFCSGQIPLDPNTQEMVKGDIQMQTRRVMENIKAVLYASNSEFSKVLKCTVFLKRISDFAAMNEVYAQYFPENPPARSAVEVSELPKGADIEIEVIAHH
jgi:2-iminobutanoate/2-iminopropanoate deaminase